ncbi:PIN domain-containing protein [bacterium]|nr:PIN domain-containing protein [bacterium]
MATRLHLDTHVVVWLHQGDLEKFSERGAQAIEKHPLVYSPIVLLELRYLFEIGRIAICEDAILADLRQQIGLEVCTSSHLEVTRAACQEDWTRDPFDRTIVAQARMAACPLLSRDRKIQDHYSSAFW